MPQRKDNNRRTALESAPNAFIGMLDGQNFGKLVVRVNNKE